MKRKIVHFIANELRDALDNQIGDFMSAEKDKLYGLSDMIDRATDILDEILEKYKGVLSADDYGDIDSMAAALVEIANDYDTSNDEIEVDVELIKSSQDLESSSNKVIDIEVVK